MQTTLLDNLSTRTNLFEIVRRKRGGRMFCLFPKDIVKAAVEVL